MTAARRKRRIAYSRKPPSFDLPAGLLWLDAVPIKPVHWLWNGYVPRGVVTLVEGNPGAGKSSLLRELVACVTTGRPMPGDVEASEPAGVLWLSSEEDVGVQLRPVIEAAGGDASLVAVLDDDGWHPRMLDVLAATIIDHGIALVVIDQIKDHLESLGDESETNVRAAMLPWVRLAQRTGAAVVGVRHWRKGAGSAADRGAGSVGYLAVARQTLVVGPHDGCRVVAVGKSYRTTPSSLACQIDDRGCLQWRGETTLTADDVAAWQPSASNGAPRASPARDGAVDRLRAELVDGPRKASDVRAALRAAGCSSSSIDRARDDLGTVREGEGKATMWSLPPTSSPP